jgi:hypothetical protein
MGEQMSTIPQISVIQIMNVLTELMAEMVIVDAKHPEDAVTVTDVQNFAEAGIATHGVGIVVSLSNGHEFQVSIRRSK